MKKIECVKCGSSEGPWNCGFNHPYTNESYKAHLVDHDMKYSSFYRDEKVMAATLKAFELHALPKYNHHSLPLIHNICLELIAGESI